MLGTFVLIVVMYSGSAYSPLTQEFNKPDTCERARAEILKDKYLADRVVYSGCVKK